MIKRNIDLLAPKKPGEPEYDTLALTRLLAAIRFDMLSLIVGMAVAVAVLVPGLVVFMYVTIHGQHVRTHEQCVSSNNGRAAIKDAFGDLYDGFITSSGHSQPAVDFKNTHMARLEKKLPQRPC